MVKAFFLKVLKQREEKINERENNHGNWLWRAEPEASVSDDDQGKVQKEKNPLFHVECYAIAAKLLAGLPPSPI